MFVVHFVPFMSVSNAAQCILLQWNATIITWRYRSNLHWSQRLRRGERARERAAPLFCCCCSFLLFISAEAKNYLSQNDIHRRTKKRVLARMTTNTLARFEIKARALAVCVMVNEHMSQIMYHLWCIRDMHMIFFFFCSFTLSSFSEYDSKLALCRGGAHTQSNGPRFVCVEWVICEMIIMRFYAPVFIFKMLAVRWLLQNYCCCCCFFVCLLFFSLSLLSFSPCFPSLAPAFRFVRRIGFNLSFLDVCNLH